jgi:hypothetical protein
MGDFHKSCTDMQPHGLKINPILLKVITDSPIYSIQTSTEFDMGNFITPTYKQAKQTLENAVLCCVCNVSILWREIMKHCYETPKSALKPQRWIYLEYIPVNNKQIRPTHTVHSIIS